MLLLKNFKIFKPSKTGKIGILNKKLYPFLIILAKNLTILMKSVFCTQVLCPYRAFLDVLWSELANGVSKIHGRTEKCSL